MKENFLKLSQSIIFSLVVAAAFLTPLFFLPTTSEFFEFNKFTAILILTIASFIVWAVKMVFEKRVVFTRTPLDIPILLILAVYFIAAYSSIDQFISFFGIQGRIWPSFIPLFVISAFYFVSVATLKTKRQVNTVLWTLVGAATIAALIAVTSYFGAFLPFDFARIRSFNPLGIINRLALLEALVIPIAASWAIYEKDRLIRIVATGCTLILAFSFILINDLASYIGLAVALVFLTVGTLRVKLTKTQQGHAAVLAVFVILFLVIRFIPQVAQGTLYQWIIAKDQGLTEQQQIDTPKEQLVPAGSAWDIAAQAIGKKPLFGTGPGTYQFVYTQLKPRAINGTTNWAVRFDKSSSDFTDVIATTGVFGVLAYLLLIVVVLRFVWSLIFKSQHTLVYLPPAAAILGYIIASFFTVSSFATFSSFFLALAMLAVLAKATSEDYVFEVTLELAALKNRFSWFPIAAPGEGEALLKTEAGAKGAKSQILPAVFGIVVAVLSFLALAYQVNAYRADYYYRQSLLAAQSNNGNRTVQFLQAAIQANPRIDTYHRALSQTTLNAAINLSQQKDLNDSQKQLLGQLAQVAIDQGKAASGYQILPLKLPGISAANVANWETLGAVYQALIGAVQGADVHATNTLAQAVSLDPQNPILHNRLGVLYQRLGNTDLAQRKFEDAIITKGDYGPAHYNLANILIDKKGSVPTIVSELSLAKQYLPQDDPAISDINKKLDDYNKQLRDLQGQAAKQQGQQPSASPSPSPSPSPQASAQPSPSPTQRPSF